MRGGAASGGGCLGPTQKYLSHLSAQAGFNSLTNPTRYTRFPCSFLTPGTNSSALTSSGAFYRAFETNICDRTSELRLSCERVVGYITDARIHSPAARELNNFGRARLSNRHSALHRGYLFRRTTSTTTGFDPPGPHLLYDN